MSSSIFLQDHTSRTVIERWVREWGRLSQGGEDRSQLIVDERRICTGHYLALLGSEATDLPFVKEPLVIPHEANRHVLKDPQAQGYEIENGEKIRE